MSYVDGFLLAVPKQNIEAYKAMARKAGAKRASGMAMAYARQLRSCGGW
jgi:uncharacterized protein YbaA (DUF1428 family)